MKKNLLFGLSLAISLALLPSLVFAVATPRQLTPPNNASGYNKNASNFYWSKIIDAEEYQLRVKKNNNDIDTNPTVDVASSLNYFSLSDLAAAGILNDGATYYWRVRSKKGSDYSNWSSIYKFTTGSAPAAATLIFPKEINGNISAINKSLPKDFTWKAGRDTVFSNVKIYNTDPTGSTCLTDPTNLRLEYQVRATKISSGLFTGFPEGIYCWTAQTCNNIGCAAEAPLQKFNLTKHLVAPNLIFVSTGYAGATFYWEKTNATNPTATIWVSKLSGFPVGPKTVNTTSDNNYLVAPTAMQIFIDESMGADLYWKVCYDGAICSKTSKFKSVFLTSPALLSPGEIDDVATSTATFKWGKTTNASFYEIVIEKETAPNTFVPFKSQYVSGQAIKMSAIDSTWAYGTKYKWSVTAINDFTKSKASDWREFTTIAQ